MINLQTNYKMASKYLIERPVNQEDINLYIADMAAAIDAGGHSFFLGQVRADMLNGKIVRAIEYSAYDSMADNEADKIIEMVTAEFDDVKSVKIIHSTGVVRAGEISLAVMVSAGHRKQAIEACYRTVELIKEKLPVWKKEIYEDNSHAWKENEPQGH